MKKLGIIILILLTLTAIALFIVRQDDSIDREMLMLECYNSRA